MKIRKLPYIALIFILIISNVSNLGAQDTTHPDFNFSYTFGSDGYDVPYQLASDSQGNVILVEGDKILTWIETKGTCE